MDNPLYLVLYTIASNDPAIFWLFIALIVLGVAITYTYRMRAGLLITAIVSAFFYWISEFLQYLLVIMIISFFLLLIDLLGLSKTGRHLKNFVNWFYLKYRVKQSKKRFNTK